MSFIFESSLRKGTHEHQHHIACENLIFINRQQRQIVQNKIIS